MLITFIWVKVKDVNRQLSLRRSGIWIESQQNNVLFTNIVAHFIYLGDFQVIFVFFCHFFFLSKPNDLYLSLRNRRRWRRMVLRRRRIIQEVLVPIKVLVPINILILIVFDKTEKDRRRKNVFKIIEQSVTYSLEANLLTLV